MRIRLRYRYVVIDVRCHDGFTLVELLVVLAIIRCFALGLLLACRFSLRVKRRGKRIAETISIRSASRLSAYHNVQRSLPIGCLEWRPWGGPAIAQEIWRGQRSLLAADLASKRLYEVGRL